jgi:AcrR family transcriptional regulator
MPRPRSRSDEQIVAGAFRAIGRRGAAVTLADVAAEAGMAPSSLAGRFGSKRGLLDAVAQAAAAGAAEAFARSRRREAGPLDALVAALADLARTVRTRPAFAHHLGLLQADVADPALRRVAARHAAALRGSARELLEEAVAQGELAPVADPDALARAVHVAYNGSLVAWALGGRGALAAAIDHDVRAVLAPWRLAASAAADAATPPYAGEGAHALWHVSEDRRVGRFAPRPAADGEAVVWAIDTRHLPSYWFPRECPRATFWTAPHTTAADAERFLLGASARVHAIQADWLDAVRAARVVAYRLPPEPFRLHDANAGYWVSAEAVEPLEAVELGDLLARHADAGIELRVVPRLAPLWERVVASTLAFSGIRLRNLVPASRA